MEEEDDDLYGTGPANGTGEAQQAAGQNGGNKVDEDLESGEEEEEDEEDSESVREEKSFGIAHGQSSRLEPGH